MTGADTGSQQALSVNPGSTEALNDLGGIFYRKKDYNSARLCFERALTLNPGLDPARKNLELTKRAMGAR